MMTKEEYAKEAQWICDMTVHISIISEDLVDAEKFVREEMKKDVDKIDFEEIEMQLGYIEFKQLEIRYFTRKVNEKIALLRNVEFEK